jgi:anti-sigma factor RsiW
MDHSYFKANQTAAAYVANGLDEQMIEAFELHMMDCPECVTDAESWRAIKHNMPQREQPQPAASPAALIERREQQRQPAGAGWRMAASVLIGGLLGVAGGWLGHAARTPDLGSTQTVFFNMPPPTRAADECAPVRLAPDSRLAVLRVPGVSRARHVVATDSEGHELPASRYSTRIQPDGSYLMRIDVPALEGRTIRLETKTADGSNSEPFGCVAGQVGLAQ